MALFLLPPLFFVFGYALQRFVIGPASHGDDRNMLLVTLGIAVIIENALLYNFRADTRTIDVPYAFQTFNVGLTYLAVPRVVGFFAVFVVALALWLLMTFTEPTARTTAGVVRGRVEGGLRVFRGVRYTSPLVGEGRWLPAEPVASNIDEIPFIVDRSRDAAHIFAHLNHSGPDFRARQQFVSRGKASRASTDNECSRLL